MTTGDVISITQVTDRGQGHSSLFSENIQRVPGENTLIPEDGGSITGVKRLRITHQVRDALHESQAAVPAQQGIIVSLWTDLLRLFKTAHGIFKAGQQRMPQT